MDSLGSGRPRAGRYLLRGVLSCRPCGSLLLPVFASNGRRYYGCPARHCPRPWIPAELAERLVWARVVALRGAMLDGMHEARRAALGEVLDRVTVGIRPADLEYHWREPR